MHPFPSALRHDPSSPHLASGSAPPDGPSGSCPAHGLRKVTEKNDGVNRLGYTLLHRAHDKFVNFCRVRRQACHRAPCLVIITLQDTMADIQIHGERRDEAQRQFAGLGDPRPGSLLRSFTKCGRPNRRCARDGDPGHPGHVPHRSPDGWPKTVRIRAGEAEDVAAQINGYHRFRAMAQEFLEASEALADAKLASGRGGGARKGGC